MRFALIIAHCIVAAIQLTAASKNIVFDAFHRDFPTGETPVGIAVADFNEDGKKDLVTANFGDVIVGGGSSVTLLLASGAESFRPGITIWSSGTAQAVVAADFNGDGHADIAIAASSLVILLGNGNGTFQAPVTVPNVSDALCAATADFNHDGIPDLAVCNSGASAMQILLGIGDGTFQAPKSYPAGNTPNSVVVADLNQDGDQDLIVANLSTSGGVSILYGERAGAFRSVVTYPLSAYCYYAAAGDVNQDGIPDIVASCEGNSSFLIVLTGSPDNRFSKGSVIGTSGTTLQFLLLDLNGDGIPDIATPNLFGTDLQLFNGIGDGTFTPGPSLATGQGPEWVVATRVEKSAPIVLITANELGNSVSVLGSRGNGQFGPPSFPYPVGASGATAIASGDVNGDGIPDLVVTNGASNNISVLLGAGNGRFTATQNFATGNGPMSLALVDLNRDGNLDVVTANNNDGSVSVLLGNGDGTFQPHQDRAVGVQTQFVAVGDMNNDGLIDVVASSVESGNITTLYSDGKGGFQSASDYYFGGGLPGVTEFQITDFNGDGNLDIVGEFFYGSGIVVLLGDGTTHYTLSNSCVCNLNAPDGLAIADFNHDGKPDIAFAQYGGNDIAVSLNVNGTFGQPVNTGLYAATLLTAGDFNGDGYPDLVATSFESNLLYFYLGSANGSPLFSSIYGVNLSDTVRNPMIAVVGDFNADGKLDVAVAQSDGVAVLLNAR